MGGAAGLGYVRRFSRLRTETDFQKKTGSSHRSLGLRAVLLVVAALSTSFTAFCSHHLSGVRLFFLIFLQSETDFPLFSSLDNISFSSSRQAFSSASSPSSSSPGSSYNRADFGQHRFSSVAHFASCLPSSASHRAFSFFLSPQPIRSLSTPLQLPPSNSHFRHCQTFATPRPLRPFLFFLSRLTSPGFTDVESGRRATPPLPESCIGTALKVGEGEGFFFRCCTACSSVVTMMICCAVE